MAKSSDQYRARVFTCLARSGTTRSQTSESSEGLRAPSHLAGVDDPLQAGRVSPITFEAENITLKGRTVRLKRWLASVACAGGLVAGLLGTAPTATAADQLIGSARVQVEFDAASGVPERFVFPQWNNAWLRGNHGAGDGDNLLSAGSRRTSDNADFGEGVARSLRFESFEQVSATRMKAHYNAYWSDLTTKTASLAIQYDVAGAEVSITLQDVVEEPGFELISANLHSLLTVREEDGGQPWILDANGGGRLSSLADAPLGSRTQGGEGPQTPYYPVQAVGTTGAAAALEILGYLDTSHSGVETSASGRHGSLGFGAQYRVRGGSSTPNLLVNQPEIARLTFAGDYDADGDVDWMDVAKTMRDTQAPPIPSHYYEDKFTYMVKGDTQRGDVMHTFAEAEQLAGRISNLIDGNPQVMQFAGMFEGGHDTVEPNYTQVNPLLGGSDGLKALQGNSADLYNTHVTFDDNYDDLYNNEFSCGTDPGSCFNSADVAHDIDNEEVRHRAWNGVDLSYIAGMKKYVDSGRALDRARGTITGYGLHDAALIDAMSWWALRHDFDPEHPASAVENLTGGKFRILDEYAKYGIAVNSELMRYPFLGRIALNVDGPRGGGWAGGFDKEVPFMGLVLRHSQMYGGKYGESAIPDMKMNVDPKVMLVNNNNGANWFDRHFDQGSGVTDQEIADAYYLVSLPWMLLSKLDIQDFTRSADGKSIHETLSDDAGNTAVIDIDYTAADSFSAVYNGVQIMNGYSVTVPMAMDESRIAFYSRDAQTLTYPLPSGSDASKVRASALYADHREEISAPVADGNISVDVPAGVPVVVYLDQEAPVMVNDSDTTVLDYAGDGWFHSAGRGLGDYDDDVHATTVDGDAVTVTFEGTGIDVISEKNSDQGEAEVYLDGVLTGTVDFSAAGRSTQVPVYGIGGLPYGTHTLKLVKKTGQYMLIDAVRTYANVPTTQTVNDSYAGIGYTGGGWQHYTTRALGDYFGDVHATTANGDSATFTFYGTGVDVISEKNSDQGDISVSIDGGPPRTVSTYASSRQVQQTIFSAGGLTPGAHTITLTKQSGEYMLLDALTTHN